MVKTFYEREMGVITLIKDDRRLFLPFNDWAKSSLQTMYKEFEAHTHIWATATVDVRALPTNA